MSIILGFWAQALDNSSADSISLNDRLLAPNDEILRQKAVSFVSETALAGKKIDADSGVVLTVTKCAFVLEIMPSQTDAVGRAAPVVCFGDIPPQMDDFEQIFMPQLDHFAASIRREISSEQRGRIVLALRKIKKNRSFRKNMIGLTLLIVGICAGLGILAMLHFKGKIL